MFIIQVNKSEVKVLLTEKLYAFAKNIYKMHVVWSNEWCGLTKIAHFCVDGTKFDIDMTHLDEVGIPWELFATKCAIGKELKVSFEGTWKDHIVIPTPLTSLGSIRKSNIEDACDYVPPAPPTPDIYQQLRDELDAKADDASFDPETRTFRLWANKLVISEFEIPGGSGEGGAGTGEDGKSAYEIAVENGFEGTEEEWLESLKGKDGKSAYQIAVQLGFQGTEEDWLESLKGKDGKSAYAIAVQEGFDGSEAEWLASLKGQNGTSPTVSIQPISGGHRVTITDVNGSHSFDVMDGTSESGSTPDNSVDNTIFFAKFEQTPAARDASYILPKSSYIGKTPVVGNQYRALIGDSSRMYWCAVTVSALDDETGNATVTIASVNPLTIDAYSKEEIDQMFEAIGSGTDGESAYDIAVRNGFEGTEEEWLASLKGKNGATFTPSVSESGELSWTNDGGLPNPNPVSVIGPSGKPGATPYIGSNGNWWIGETDTGVKASSNESSDVPVYTFGDGLTQDGDTVSVTTPVRGIYTQTEFNELPEEQKKKGVYIVDNGRKIPGVTMGDVNAAISVAIQESIGQIETALSEV